MSMEMLNRIIAAEARAEQVLEEMKAIEARLNDRMDRIEYRKKPGPKPRRLKEKLNDE